MADGFPVYVRPALCRKWLGEITGLELAANMELAEALYRAAYPNKDAWEAMKPALEVIVANWEQRQKAGQNGNA